MRLSDFSALTFDCYGTLIDWERGVLEALSPWRKRSGITTSPAALIAAYGRHETVIQMQNPALSYRNVVAKVLDHITDELGVSALDSERETFGNSIGQWPPFSDSIESLAYLREHFVLATITNVDNQSFAQTHRLLGEPFHLLVTAQDVGSYKPALENFHHTFNRLEDRDIARDKILHIAQSLYHDIAPARALGLANIWVDRQNGQGSGMTPPSKVQPDLRITTLTELVNIHRSES